MLGKRLIYKRSVMIALAVFALMTLTAGVAAAAANTVKFDAVGGVLLVGLEHPGSVKSEFKYRKNGKIKSIEISTIGEAFAGVISEVTKCKKPGAECDALTALLESNGIASVHTSTATLKVKGEPHPYPPFPFIQVVTGKLKGKLESTLYVGPHAGVPDLIGGASLKIKSTEPVSYACLWGAAFVDISYCETYAAANDDQGVIFVNPVLIPVDLHVKDKGTFWVDNSLLIAAPATVELKGKIEVVLDSQIGFVGANPVFDTSGTIKIKKSRANFITP